MCHVYMYHVYMYHVKHITFHLLQRIDNFQIIKSPNFQISALPRDDDLLLLNRYKSQTTR